MKNIFIRAITMLLAISFFTLAGVPALATSVNTSTSTKTTTTTSASTSTFKDVKATAWYYTYVNKLMDLKITSGYKDGTYKPANSVTRAEFVTFLCKTKGYAQTAGDPFSDTQKHWASGYITIALANGIIDLPTDKKFRPNDAITRLEAVEMMCRALNIDKDTTTKNPYADVNYITGYTNAAYANYLMQGSIVKNARYFKPSDKLTRGEVASVIVNAYEYNADKMGYLNKKIAEANEKALNDALVASNSTWSKANLNFCIDKEIIDIASFKPNEMISASKYIEMLVRTMGKTNEQDYIKTALNLGVIKSGEFKSYDKKITRAEMTKLALRVYERLNKVTYQDYLEAYKTMVTDFSKLTVENKQLSVKSVSEGIVPVIDGAFKPNDTCTEGYATAVMHRILIAEQRNKVKPIFAKADKEFEDFIADYNKSYEYCSRGNFYKVIDGKILWNTYEDGVCLLPTLSNPDSNKEAYEAVKTLLSYARKYNHWVEADYRSAFGSNMLQIFYASSQKGGQLGKAREVYDFAMLTRFNEDKLIRVYSDVGEENKQKEKTDYYWKIGRLFNATNINFHRTLEEYQEKELVEPLTAWLNIIYEPKMADYLLKYILKDNETYNVYSLSDKRFNHQEVIYPQQFKGLEVQVKRDGGLLLGTNKIN